MASIQDSTYSTVGWFTFAAGTVGITQGQTLRLSIVNLGSLAVTVVGAMMTNPSTLIESSFTLQPGESRDIDLRASDLSKKLFDKTSRAQIRPFIRASALTIQSNLEVFNDRTGITTIVLPVQAT